MTQNRFTITCLPAETGDSSGARYTILDSGDGQKLEDVGGVKMIRPEPQAIWPKTMPELWQHAHVHFLTAADKQKNSAQDDDPRGSWETLKPHKKLDDSWPVSLHGLTIRARLMRFRHIGFFPEQQPIWQNLINSISCHIAENPQARQPKILNLFGYTGVASLAAAMAGAHVTHVDASPKAIKWGQENQEASGLETLPIRWLVDDAMKFVAREIRRGNQYDGILLDPPKYGRGPKGETWHLREQLPELMTHVHKILSPSPLFVILTAYAERLSALTLAETLQAYCPLGGGHCDALELANICGASGRILPTAMVARWQSTTQA